MFKDYWKEYYSNRKTPTNPSPFAVDMAKHKYIKSPGILIELGCGNGRDAIFLKDNLNLNIIAIDQCDNEIEFLNENFGSEKLSFISADFSMYNPPDTVNNVYSRWTLHSIDEEAEDRTINWVTESLIKGGRFIVEARSIKDNLHGIGKYLGNDAYLTDHYRRFMRIDKFSGKLQERGLKIIHSVESRGLAVHKDDDPVVIRIVAEK